VLLSTTIVESGLDIPTANTLIVHRADMFGLAQLYQLRGRVGRSKTRAYAYSRLPADRKITEAGGAAAEGAAVARQRSAPASSSPATTSTSAAPAICSATSSPATSRRSASSSTSRCSRRRSSSRRPAAWPRRDEFTPQISVDAPILIPEDYVPDLDLRMGLYRRLGELEDRQAIDAFAAELIDRFGAMSSG
jgi:transcription-repair coupling factor (superfamily II helicase)